MKIGIIGRSEWMYNTAVLMLNNGYEINFIITAKESSEYKYNIEDFKEFSKNNNINFLISNNLGSPSTLSFLNENKCDIVLSVNYSSIIPKQVVEMFSMGILNAHGGDLPRYRGNACQAWAILNGENKVGLCVHKMIGGELDSGDIIARSYKKIDINTRILEIYDWMESKIPRLFLEAIFNLIKNPNYKLEVQSKNPKDILRCYPRKPEDGLINWSMSSNDIVRLVNASSEPYSGAYVIYNNVKLIIWRASVFDDNEIFLGVNGQITDINKKEGYIIILSGGYTKVKLEKISYGGVTCKPSDIFKSLRIRLV